MYESNISDLKRVPVGKIEKFHYGNPHVMSEHMSRSLENSLVEIGVMRPMIARKRGKKYEILNGHHRYDKMVENGITEVDVLVVDMPDDRKARMLALSLNNISADWDTDALRDYIRGFAEGRMDWLASVVGFTSEDMEELADQGTEAFAEFAEQQEYETMMDLEEKENEEIRISDAKVLVKRDAAEAYANEHVSFSLKLPPELYDLLTRALKHGKKHVWRGCKSNEIFARIFQRLLGETPDLVYTSAREERRKAAREARAAEG